MNETDSALVNEPHKIIQVLGFFKLMTGSGKIEKRKKKQRLGCTMATITQTTAWRWIPVT